MSYENSYTLKIIKLPETTKNIMVCEKCGKECENGNFCQECGSTLKDKEIKIVLKSDDIISEFRESSEDARYLLSNNGSTNSTGSGHYIKTDLSNFSLKYPSAIFQLDVAWETSSFDEPPSRYYFQKGKMQKCKVEIVYEAKRL